MSENGHQMHISFYKYIALLGGYIQFFLVALFLFLICFVFVLIFFFVIYSKTYPMALSRIALSSKPRQELFQSAIREQVLMIKMVTILSSELYIGKM